MMASAQTKSAAADGRRGQRLLGRHILLAAARGRAAFLAATPAARQTDRPLSARGRPAAPLCALLARALR